MFGIITNPSRMCAKKLLELGRMRADLDSLPSEMRQETQEIFLKQSALCSLLLELNVPQGHIGDVVLPDELLLQVPMYRRIVNGAYEQHDVLEFAQHILETFAVDSPGFDSDIGASFRTTWEDAMHCNNCKERSPWIVDHSTVTVLNFREDHVAGGIVALGELWSDQLTPTCMDGRNQVECRNCHGLQTASKMRRIIKFPQNLLIGIQRAGLNGQKRFLNPVSLPMAFTPLGSTEVYHLRCVAHHTGRTSRSGHYVAQRLFDGGWWDCNDAVTSLNVASLGDVYMVIYTKDPPARFVERPVAASAHVQSLPRGVSQTKSGLHCNMCSMVFAARHSLDDHVRSSSHKLEAISWVGIKETPGRWSCQPCPSARGDAAA